MNKVFKLSDKEIKRCLKKLRAYGWNSVNSSNPYIEGQFKGKSLVAIIYSSGKVMFQGSEKSFEWQFIDDCLNKKSNYKKFVAHIGVDEAGKGDFFGPLVTASAFLDEHNYRDVIKLGVMDSKKVSDKKIRKMISEIESLCLFEVSILMPEDFNREYKSYQNINKLLAYQHSLVIEKLLQKLNKKDIACPFVLIDQFSKNPYRVSNVLGTLGKGIEFRQMHGGEADLSVATASIIARYHFIEAMDQLSNQWNIEFPKGATAVVEKGKEFVSKYGADSLSKVAKINFKTMEKVVSLF